MLVIHKPEKFGHKFWMIHDDSPQFPGAPTASSAAFSPAIAKACNGKELAENMGGFPLW